MSLIESLKQRLSENRFASAVLTLVTGQALGQMIGLLTTPIVSRLYDTSAYGEYAILVSTATIICTVSQAGLASAIMMPEDDKDAIRIFNAASFFQIVVSTLVILVFLIFASSFHVVELRIPYYGSLALLWLYVVLTNYNNLLRIYMNRLRLYRALFWNSLLSAFATLFITIPMGFLHTDLNGLIVAACIGAFACIIQMLHRANPFHLISIRVFFEVLREYKRFVVLQLPANLVSTLSLQLPNQIMGNTYGNAALGSFSMSNKILGIPSRLLASPVNTVYFKTAVDYVHQRKDLAKFTFSLVKKIMLGWAPLIILLIGFGEPIFAFVLGEQWREAGFISSILSFQYMLTFCVTCTSYCRVALDRQGVNLVMAVVSLAVIGLSLLIGISLNDGVIGVISCFAIGSCIAQTADMFVSFLCMGSYQLKYLAFTVGYIAIVGLLGLLIRFAIC